MASWWARLFGRDRKLTSLELFREVYGGRATLSGKTVSVATALEVSTVLACCRVLANGIAQVPWRLYRDVDGRRGLATEHPLYLLLYRRPNPWQTSFEFRETLMFHTLLTGNAFVFVNRVGIARTIKELVPIEPRRVEVRQRTDLSLEYRVSDDDGSWRIFGADAIWHVRGPSWNSWMGMEAIKLAREAIGLSISLEQGQAEFQKNGAKTSGVLATKEKLSKERFDLLASWLDKHMPGGDRFGKPVIVDDSTTYTSTLMSAVDQQLIETRKHQIEEICRGFGVMPIMVGQADKTATYASAEQMFLAHVVHGLSPHYARLEQSGDVNLLSEADLAAGYYTKFTPNALMRGAANDRASFYAKGLGSGGSKGWLTQNDVRGFEDMDRSDDPKADELPQATGKPAPQDSTKENADAA